MEFNTRVLRINIEGRWEASEFSQSFLALDRLYTMRFALSLEKQELMELREFYFDRSFPKFSRSLRHIRYWENFAPLLRSERSTLISGREFSAYSSELLEPEECLVVKRIIYGSPGIKDLGGIGEIIGHLKDFLLRIIELCATKEKRALENQHQALENERLALDNQQKRIEIAKQFVDLADDMGYTKREKRQLVAAVVAEQQPLIKLISDGKITAADTIDEPEQ